MDKKSLSKTLMGKKKGLKKRLSEKRNCDRWTELPEDVTALILSRLRTIDILGSAQMVCKTWHHVCNHRLEWRAIDMRSYGLLDRHHNYDLDMMCRSVVYRSWGNLVAVNIENFGTDDLLKYITDSSSGIRRLRLACCDGISNGGLREAVPKLAKLEDLEISLCDCGYYTIEVIGRSCPLLKSFKLNRSRICDRYSRRRADAYSIAETMRGLRHLQLVWNAVNNEGLQKILESCPYLESLDLRCCFSLRLEEGDSLMTRCKQQIETLRLPNDSVHDYEFSKKTPNRYAMMMMIIIIGSIISIMRMIMRIMRIIVGMIMRLAYYDFYLK